MFGDAGCTIEPTTEQGIEIFKEVTGKDWEDGASPYRVTTDELNKLRLNYIKQDLLGNVSVSGNQVSWYPLRESYIKHHYIVPVLNNVVVLINAVAK